MKAINFPQRSFCSAIVRHGLPGRLALWAVVFVLAMGCRSTPPPTEEPPQEELVEEPELEEDEEADTVEEELDDEEDVDDDDDDDLLVEDEEGERDEEVASHVEARIDSALADARQGNVDDAMDALSSLVDEPEGGFLAAYNLGVLYEARGEIESAIDYYDQALRRQADFTPALTNLVRIYIRAGEIDQADTMARALVEMRPDNLDHRAAHLEVVLADGRYEDVTQGARFILRRDVDHVDAMIQFARAKYYLEQYEFAEAIASTALDLAPHRAEGYYVLGKIAWNRDDISRATQLFEMSVERDRQFLEARNNYAVLLHTVGDYLGAVEQLKETLEIAPNFVDAYINLGNAKKELCAQIMADENPDEPCTYEEAADAYREAVEVDPENAEAWMNLGLLYLEAPVGDLEEMERLERAIEAFETFREEAGPRRASETSVGDYLSMAHERIDELEEELEEERRQQAEQEEQAQQEAEEQGQADESVEDEEQIQDSQEDGAEDEE